MNRGSPALCRLGAPGRSGFNEAPIHESGKCQDGFAPCREQWRASMRPRFMNRGSSPETGRT